MPQPGSSRAEWAAPGFDWEFPSGMGGSGPQRPEKIARKYIRKNTEKDIRRYAEDISQEMPEYVIRKKKFW